MPDEVPDVAVERGREQHRLGATGAVAQDPLDLWREPVVGHAVGLVEAHDLDRTEVDLVRLQQVDQAQRGGDHELDAACQVVDLAVPAGPAVDREDLHAGVGGDRLEHLGHLHGELARRHEHQAERLARLGDIGDAGEHRHAEGERLAGTGLGPTAHVAALHGDRDGLGLDRERLGESARREARVDPLRNAERGESGGCLDRRQGVDRGEVAGAIRFAGPCS